MKHSTKTADGHLQKELSDTIYLQLHGDNEYVGNNEEIDFGDVTWSEDRTYPTDVEYAKVKSPWIRVEERLPEELESVLVLSNYEGKYLYEVAFIMNGKWICHNNKPAYWTPIPSFDEILEANKDVLERIKQKGD